MNHKSSDLDIEPSEDICRKYQFLVGDGRGADDSHIGLVVAGNSAIVKTFRTVLIQGVNRYLPITICKGIAAGTFVDKLTDCARHGPHL
jgi:hypothetical protein